jgi:hypothetical protein
MTGVMQTISDALPSGITALTDPWLGTSGLGTRIAVLGAWAIAALAAIGWIVHRGRATR